MPPAAKSSVPVLDPAWIRALTDPAVTGRVHLAGFPSPLTMPNHWDTGELRLEEHLLYLPLAGEARVSWAGGAATVPLRHLAIVPPALAFRVRAGGRSPVLVARLRVDLRREGRPLPLAATVLVLPAAGAVAGILECAAAAEEARDDDGWSARLLLAATLLRLASPPAADLPALARARHWALANLQRRPTPADMARVAGLSSDYFARAFRRACGQSPRAWLLASRMRQAAVLLAVDARPIAAVAAEVGCDDPNLFSRQFRSVLGASPQAWRAGRRGVAW